MPGRHVEFGETTGEELKREIMEEFNVDINVGDPFYVFTYTSNDDTEHAIEVGYFATMVDPGQNIALNPNDYSEFHWISQAEFLDFFEKDGEEGKAIKKGFEILNEKN